MTTAARMVLPHRRPSVTVFAEWQGHPITVTVGFCPASAAPREVFADAVKGGQMQATLADACVLISLALQHGLPPAALAKSLARCPDVLAGGGADMPASPIGAIVDLIDGVM